MSRLEKGQRRIDARVLHKIAKALDVKPSFFFGEEGIPESIGMTPVHRDIGKMIRSERRRRHLSAEELGKKISKPRSYVLAVEGGEIELLTNEILTRICRALKMDATKFFEAQQGTIQTLRRHIQRLENAHADRTLGSLDPKVADSPEASPRRAIPVLGPMGGAYPSDFGIDGEPLAEVEDYVFVPRIDDERAFALHVLGDSMERRENPCFREGDIVVFSGQGEVRSRDFVFARLEGHRPIFRQVFFDATGGVRLQPLNLSFPPVTYPRAEVVQMWRLVAHLQRH
jgi:transcriptional regulator with XRE-family HTH domain